MVDARDGRRCRCCDRREGLHKHHLQFRSRGGADSADNLVTLCKFCHALLHARQLWIQGTDASKRLRFEIHEAAVADAFGSRVLPKHVHIVTGPRR
jgi:5-methylcytosine-specific restriction endonuclease McrA